MSEDSSYYEVLKQTQQVLRLQLAKAEQDIETLVGIKHRAMADPVAFVHGIATHVLAPFCFLFSMMFLLVCKLG